MTPHLTFLEPPPPLPPGRNVHCNCCGMLVRVYDIPPHVDEDKFIGGCCLQVVRPPVPFNEFPPGYGEPT